MAGGMSAAIPILTGVAELSAHRKAWLCDIWGVLHDGLTPFAPAIEACCAFKKSGGEIVLISNSPKTSAPILAELGALGLPSACFTALVTAGDVTRRLIEDYAGKPVFHLGPEEDECLFEGLDVEFVSADHAAVIVCTGLFDEELETPEDYDGMFAGFAARGVPMICANPDLFVERGSQLLPCAGLLAERYAALGQTVIQAGKPHQPIYDAAMRKLSRPLLPAEMLAIGDGIGTDIKGASDCGIDSVYIVSRVHMGDAAESGANDLQLLGRLFADNPFRPVAAMSQLRW